MEHTENTAVGCVIMASGRAVRFGSNKLLADFGGAPLIVRALDAAETPALAARVVVTRSPEVAELACKAGVRTILHSLPGRNDTVRLGLEALLSELPGLAGCIFLPGDQPLLRKDSRRWCAISQRWTKKNGPSSGWAFVPRTARSGWEVPFCSEAVISAPCAPCPRARAAAWSSAGIRSLCGRYMRHGRKSWKMQIPQKSWSGCENFCKCFPTKKPPRQQLQAARRGGVLQ